ncbi:MAG: helix-turn-helix domain-containing protein [Brevefilum sp.]|jgi:cytoskeleton protein RodZ
MMTIHIGQQLKEIRESQGIPLEEIAIKTKIRLDYLRALEEGDEETLLSQVQARGFLRLYASQLGVKIADLEVKGYHLAEKEQPPLPPASKEDIPTSIEDNAAATVKHPEPVQTKLPPQAQEPQLVKSADTLPAPLEESMVGETSTSNHINLAIGNLLKERREVLSLSINDVNKTIFIPEKYLIAMESGQLDQLPSPVQARGMLQNYAQFLDLETDSLLLAYADSLQARRKEMQQESPSTSKTAAREISPAKLKLKSFFSLDLLVIAALFIIFAGFVVWGSSRILSADSPDLDATDLPEVSDILLAAGSPTPQPTQQDETIGEDTPADDSPEEEAPPLFTPRPSNYPINLLIIPRQRVWVQVTSDEEVVFEGRLIPGNAYDYFGQETVEVLTGNAGAIQIYFNDEDIGALGVVGQVSDLIFTQSGLVLPTPTNTPTITQTPEASPTFTITPSPTSLPAPTQSPFAP